MSSAIRPLLGSPTRITSLGAFLGRISGDVGEEGGRIRVQEGKHGRNEGKKGRQRETGGNRKRAEEIGGFNDVCDGGLRWIEEWSN